MQNNTFSNLAIVIPAYEPNYKLLNIINKLKTMGFPLLIVVNDGSSTDKDVIFSKLKFQNIEVIEHEKNLGKGQALKTAFKFILDNFSQVNSIVTVDADGQHLPSDINKISKFAKKNPEKFLLGVRSFSKKIPFRSQFGNILTRILFFLLTGKYIKDTQTGLRAIPKEFIEKLLITKSQRYEFEMEMLHQAVKQKLPIMQINIETVYEDDNISSHFNPLKDSIKIYRVLFRYSFISLLSAAIDYSLFLFFYKILQRIILSSILARSLAVFFNFIAARKIVFESKKNIWRTSIRYLLLVFINPLITGSITYLLNEFVNISPAYGKIAAESLMFFANFAIQKRYIF